MTREEAIEFGNKWLQINEDSKNSHTYKFIKMAIKAIEQEPILGKIRAEIKHFMYDINPSSSESDYACNYILQIIDKYKAERNDK